MSTFSVSSSILLSVRDYDLAATLDSGQVFRWRLNGTSWEGIVGKYFVRLMQAHDGIRAETATLIADWQWLRDFLQTETDLAAVLKTFPDDEPMRAAVAACSGLRVLRQDPWECLASFILSSTKQIVQIRQIVALLCERFGDSLTPPQVGRAVPCPPPNLVSNSIRPRPFNGAHGVTGPTKPVERERFYSFPAPGRIATLTESDLRACKMGFSAPHLLAAARQIIEGKLDLENIRSLALPEARSELMKLPGVGRKIADCVLLFAYGFDSAFPVDVWIERALQQLYFPRRRVKEKKLRHFAATHFGPHAGYAQQYLFHYMRTKIK